MTERKHEPVGIRRDIQWEKLTPAQRKIVIEINEKHRKKREEARKESLRQESIKRDKITSLQKSLLRGDINVDLFISELKNLKCSPETIETKLDQVRQTMKTHFNIDMDKERN